MHQILAGCCRANFPFHFGLTQLPWHTGHPFPTIPSGRCSGITRDKWKREGLVVPCSSDTHMHPSRHGSFQGCWEMLHFLFFFLFFPFPFSPCLHWAAGSGERGQDTSGMKYPPVQHNCHNSAPSSPHFCARLPQWSLASQEKVL